MADFITLSCPSCGHKLQITEDVDRFACAACGNEHIVNRSGGIVTLKPVIDSIQRVQIGVDKTASELAIKRIKEEIESLIDEISTLKGKMYEREKHTPAWDTFGGWYGRALRQIAKEKGDKYRLTGTIYKDVLDWYMKRDTRLNENDYDLLIKKLCKFPAFFPRDVLLELKNLELNIMKKENELKHHKMIVDES
jgi:ribosomal protein S27E